MPTPSNFSVLKISPADLNSEQLCKNMGGYHLDLSRLDNALVKLNFDCKQWMILQLLGFLLSNTDFND